MFNLASACCDREKIMKQFNLVVQSLDQSPHPETAKYGAEKLMMNCDLHTFFAYKSDH